MFHIPPQKLYFVVVRRLTGPQASTKQFVSLFQLTMCVSNGCLLIFAGIMSGETRSRREYRHTEGIRWTSRTILRESVPRTERQATRML